MAHARSVSTKSSSMTRSNSSPPSILLRTDAENERREELNVKSNGSPARQRGKAKQLQFEQEANLPFAVVVRVVQLDESRVAQRLHDLHLALDAGPVRLFRRLHEFGRQTETGALFAALVHGAELASFGRGPAKSRAARRDEPRRDGTGKGPKKKTATQKKSALLVNQQVFFLFCFVLFVSRSFASACHTGRFPFPFRKNRER